MDRHFLFLLSSARSGGNSETLARRAAQAAGGQHRWIDLSSIALPGFVDTRPAPPPRPVGQLAVIAGAMKAADDIVFVAPIYWYGLPAPAKLLIDHWSGWLDVPGFGLIDWIKGKRLRRTGQWLGMDWRGALHGVADAPGDIAQDSAALARAATFLTLQG